MSKLRSSLIRLASAKPELRSVLLPLLKTASFLPICSDGTPAVYDDGRDAHVCPSTGEVGPNGPIGREAGYGRSYGGDPRWMSAKYPGIDSKGNSFARGDEVLYWPSTKTFMTGKDAKDAWRVGS